MSTKMTGAELIAQERKEQIEKHGFSVANDQYYAQGQLIDAAMFCIDPVMNGWPDGWDDHFEDKIRSKDRIGRLQVAGAFIAAEIDREILTANRIEKGDAFKDFM